MSRLTLAERATTTAPMSAEQVAMCDDTARAGTNDGRIIRNLCASHEALRAEMERQRDAVAQRHQRLLEFAEKLDARRMLALSEELFALLRS